MVVDLEDLNNFGAQKVFSNGYRAQRAFSQWSWSLKSRFSMVMQLREPFLNGYGVFDEPSSLVTHNLLLSAREAFFFCVFDPRMLINLFLLVFFFCKHHWTCNIVTYAFMLRLCYLVTFFFHHANDQIGQDSFRGLSHV